MNLLFWQFAGGIPRGCPSELKMIYISLVGAIPRGCPSELKMIYISLLGAIPPWGNPSLGQSLVVALQS